MTLTGLTTKPGPDGKESSREETVPVLESTLWKQLSDASDLDAFCQAWLALQCGQIGGVAGGTVTIGKDPNQAPIAVWPANFDPSSLSHLVSLAMDQRRGVAHHNDPRQEQNGQDPLSGFAFPIVVEGEVHGVAALQLHSATEAQFRATMRQLQWGASGLRERIAREHKSTVARRAQRAQLALDMLSVALETERFGAACRALVTEIAARFDCERVSIGFVHNGHTEVKAISHSAQFGRHMNLVQLAGAAMDEALDQRALILYPPPPGEPNVTRAHDDLAKAYGSSAILTTPLFVNDRFIGAMTFEASIADAFNDERIATLDGIAAAAGPILDEKRQNDRWLIVKIVDSIRSEVGQLFGPGHAARKLITALMVAVAAIAFFWTDTYRVSSDAVIEGKIQRSVVAPLNGFLIDAPVRAGDTVKTGQLLGRLDDRDLVLERLKWVTERQRKVLEYEKAMGERNRTEQKISTTQIEQAEAQIRLADEQLARTRLIAPFDGLVISGDQTQSIGAAVQRGQILFEIAPLESYRVILDIDESQIGDIAVGQNGQLVVSSLPDQGFPLTVTKLTPVSKASEGHNTFRVEASLIGPTTALRPGMHGIAKIDVDRRRVVWIWTRAFNNWLKLSAWRWFG